MSYRSRRSSRRYARKTKANLIITILLIGFLLYATIQWILPTFINGLGFIKNTVSPSKKTSTNIAASSTLAPPVFNIPFEATTTSQINISGYGSPDLKVKLYIDDEERDVTNVSSDGSFTFQNVELSLGTNNIYGKTLGGNNEESLSSKTIKVIFDNEKPTLNVNEPEDGKIIQGGDKKVKVSGNTEVGSKLFINGSQIVVDKNGNFSMDLQINDGENIITIITMDPASNEIEIQRRVTYNP